MSKTICIYHSIDLDGWMSAAIVKHWFLSDLRTKSLVGRLGKYPDSATYHEVPNSDIHCLDFLGYNYGDPIPDLSKYDRVIMVDISFPMDEMDKLRDKKVIWLDHHISAITDFNYKWEHGWESIIGHCGTTSEITKPCGSFINGFLSTKYAACELTWQYFFSNEPMPEIVRLLGRYDCFGHKGTAEELKVLEFQYGARQCISNVEEAYDNLKICMDYNESPFMNDIWNKGSAIYSYLCTEAKQSYKNGFEIIFYDFTAGVNEHTGEQKPKRKFICINKERFNPINFGINYHADGYDGTACFYRTSDGMWAFSLYNDNGKVDCSIIAKQFGGGGHAGAAGFRVKNLERIFG